MSTSTDSSAMPCYSRCWMSTPAASLHKCCGGASAKSRSSGCYISCCRNTQQRASLFEMTMVHSFSLMPSETICKSTKWCKSSRMWPRRRKTALSRPTTVCWISNCCKLPSLWTLKKPLPCSTAGENSTMNAVGTAAWGRSLLARCGRTTKKRTLNHRVKQKQAMLGSNLPGIARRTEKKKGKNQHPLILPIHQFLICSHAYKNPSAKKPNCSQKSVQFLRGKYITPKSRGLG